MNCLFNVHHQQQQISLFVHFRNYMKKHTSKSIFEVKVVLSVQSRLLFSDRNNTQTKVFCKLK